MLFAAGRLHALGLQPSRNLPEAARALRLNLAHHWQHVGCSRRHLATAGCPRRCGHGRRCGGRGGVAQADAPRLCYRQGGARALADKPGLELGNGGELRDHELADRPGRDAGKVAEHHAGLAAALDHGQQEAGVTRQPVELGDYQHGPPGPARGEGGRQLGPICPLATLDLLELGNQLTAGRGHVRGHGLALCFQSKAGSPLALGRNPEIADKAGQGREHGLSLALVYHSGKWSFDRMILLQTVVWGFDEQVNWVSE